MGEHHIRIAFGEEIHPKNVERSAKIRSHCEKLIVISVFINREDSHSHNSETQRKEDENHTEIHHFAESPQNALHIVAKVPRVKE